MLFHRRFIFSVAFLALLGVAPGAAAAPLADDDDKRSRPSSYALPGDNVFPEGVAYQKETPFFYVSSTSDGTIFRGNLRKPQAEVFLPGGQDGRTAAVGLKVDEEERLYIAGGATGNIFVYDVDTKRLLGKFNSGQSRTFVNDVAVSDDEDAYFTDSQAPFIYKVTTDDDEPRFEVWLDLRGTVFEYVNGFNANGIAVTNDDEYLIVVQSATGKLFRISIETKEVIEIDLGGAALTNGDGILLKGSTLYVVRNQQELIVEVKLRKRFSEGRIVSQTTDPSFAFPTTIARAQGRLLVVNSQFDKRGSGPALPFTVSSIKVP